MEKSTEVTAAFTKALPKIELHAHLSGSITRECLREIWLRKRERDSDLQIPDPMIAMPPGKVDYSLKTFFQVFSNLIYLLCSDLESLRYSTRRVLQDFQDDGVRYLELRTTPRESQEHGISKEKYVSTVLEVIDEFKNEAMSTYLILSVDRTKSAAEAEIVVDLAIQFKHRGVVGVELGGNPSKGDVSIFKAAFSKAKQNGLGVTLHFAEVEFSSSPRELTTLLSFQPDRLGHVINVPDDIKDEIEATQIIILATGGTRSAP
ncbi:putative adenosine deaminase [Microsporum canis]